MDPEFPLFIRLYLDEDVHKRVAAALCLCGFDAISVHEIGRFDSILDGTGSPKDRYALFQFNPHGAL